MKLESVTAELRPRSDWEAVDLGIALSRRDFGRLFGIWWLGMLPLLLPSLVFLHGHPQALVALLWWWMPVSSRLVLFHLSRRLFGEHPSWRDVLRELPGAMGRRFFFRMIWSRFSPWRPLTMAVEDLEGLRGAAYAQRVRVLLRRGDATVITLAFWRMGLVVWLAFSLLMTASLFLPQGQGEQWWELIRGWWGGDWMEIPPSFAWLSSLALALSLALTDIFAAGAGFGIYVNHRTWIEGWDVELAFRRMGNRLRGMTGILVVGTALSLAAMTCPSRAAETADLPPVEATTENRENPDPGRVVTEIKAHKDFEIHKVKVSSRSSSSGWAGDGLAQLLGGLGLVILCALLLALLGSLAWLIWRFRHVLRRDGSGKAAVRIAVPTVVMGMDVAPESLPADIPGRALELWKVGRRHEAMSLLYRGAISRLISSVGVEIAESDTESDCLRRVRSSAENHAGYFGHLTDAWMRLAYARVVPADPEMESLCEDWPFVEGRGA